MKGARPLDTLGVGEPLIFGVTLPLGCPFIAACLGGAVISYAKVATLITFGLSDLPLALTIVAGKVMMHLAGWLTVAVCGFLFAWFWTLTILRSKV